MVIVTVTLTLTLTITLGVTILLAVAIMLGRLNFLSLKRPTGLGFIAALFLITTQTFSQDNLQTRIPTETPLLQQRLSSPDEQFLVDNYNNITLGHNFYNDPDVYTPLVNIYSAGHDKEQSLILKYIPVNKFYLSTRLGSEVGDPVFSEMGATPAAGNRVPMVQTNIIYAPNPHVKVWNSLNRVDHFSQKYGQRQKLIRPYDRPWTGGNYNPLTEFNSGISLHQQNYQLTGAWNRIWLWKYSPYSGFFYPWQGNQVLGSITLFQKISVKGGYQKLDPLLIKAPEGKWENKSAEVQFADKLSSQNMAFKYQVSAGYKNYFIALDTLIGRSKNQAFPLASTVSFEKTTRDSSLLFSALVKSKFENNTPSYRGTLGVEERFLKLQFFQKVEAYGWNPGAYHLPWEETLWGQSDKTSLANNDFFQSGARIEGGVAHVTPALNAGVTSSLARENNLPWFETDEIFTRNDQALRSGTVLKNSEALMSWVQNISLKHKLSPTLDYTAEFRYRHLFKEGVNLNYYPSPYFLGLGFSFFTPSHLKISAKSQLVGPKKVMGWREGNLAHEVPTHWEHNLSLVQYFLDDKLSLSCTALHLFGDDIYELPGEGPFRFRIILGAEYSF